MSYAPLNLKVDENLHRTLEYIAQSRNTTVDELVSETITNQFKDYVIINPQQAIEFENRL